MLDVEVLIEFDAAMAITRSIREAPGDRLQAISKLRLLLDHMENKILEFDRKSKVDDKIPSLVLMVPLGSLTTSITQQWMVKAFVKEKSDIKRWEIQRTRKKGQLFHVDLEDETGEIRCTVFDDAVDKFFAVLRVGEEYIISNAKVRKNKEMIFEMSLTDTSIVKPVKDSKYVPKTVNISVPIQDQKFLKSDGSGSRSTNAGKGISDGDGSDEDGDIDHLNLKKKSYKTIDTELSDENLETEPKTTTKNKYLADLSDDEIDNYKKKNLSADDEDDEIDDPNFKNKKSNNISIQDSVEVSDDYDDDDEEEEIKPEPSSNRTVPDPTAPKPDLRKFFSNV